MATYKVTINDRNYSSFDIFETINNTIVNLDHVVPIHHKLFSGDEFTLDNDKNVKIINSTIRSGTLIAGVLVISDNKTYGRKNKKLLYKCVPDDNSIPSFLIPYEIKHVGFSKIFVNLYVTFTFTDWDDKHPHGMLHQVFGPVDVIENFYEYQLQSKKLNASIQKFQKATNLFIKNNSVDGIIDNMKQKYTSFENREDIHIFSIDPPKSVDFDDAFSVRELVDGTTQISVYISNVTVWLDMLDLWDSVSRRVSTIYLPDTKRPMLPSILSDCLCSLQAGVTRVALFMDIIVDGDTITDIKFGNCFVKLIKNYCYEETSLLNDSKYMKIMETTKQLATKNKYCDIKDSHDVVCYLMILMNYHCAKKMIPHKTGIFRTAILEKEPEIPQTVPEDVSKHIKLFNSAKGQYINGNNIVNTRHEILDIEAYIHITSPIRRLVDLLNMIQFQQITDILHFEDKVYDFYTQWMRDLEYINVSMKSIRKVQNDCHLLDICSNNPSIMKAEYTGYMFNKIVKSVGLYTYTVFLPELKMTSHVTTNEEFDNYQNRVFKLYLFNDEENLKKKIRLQLVSTYKV
jgi:exoribonuclease R